MKKFEYKEALVFSKLSMPELNDLGKDGWELCNLRLGFVDTYTFKREITENEQDYETKPKNRQKTYENK